MAEFTKACTLQDLAPGKGKSVEIGGQRIAVFNVDGAIYATQDACPHRGGPLGDEGILNGDEVTCGWHGWQYNVKTGVSPYNPEVKVATYPVRIEGDTVLVEI